MPFWVKLVHHSSFLSQVIAACGFYENFIMPKHSSLFFTEFSLNTSETNSASEIVISRIEVGGMYSSLQGTLSDLLVLMWGRSVML